MRIQNGVSRSSDWPRFFVIWNIFCVFMVSELSLNEVSPTTSELNYDILDEQQPLPGSSFLILDHPRNPWFPALARTAVLFPCNSVSSVVRPRPLIVPA